MKKYLIILFFAVSLSACQVDPTYSIIPAISFVSFEKIDSVTEGDYSGRLTFYFQDGDGDIGLTDSDLKPPFDTSSVYYYNFFCSYFEKQNGIFVPIELPLSQNARIPVLSNNVPESIEGKISLDLFLNPFYLYDTIRFDFYIVDRELHKSNVVSTPEIIISKLKNS